MSTGPSDTVADGDESGPECERADERIEALEADLAAKERDLAAKERELAAANEWVSWAETELEDATRRIEALETALAAEYEQNRERAEQEGILSRLDRMLG